MKNNNFLQMSFDFNIHPKKQIKKLSNREKNNFLFDILDPLQSPIIVHNWQWGNNLPNSILSRIREQRLLYSLQKKETATFAEVVVYLYTASLQFPLNNEWTDIYIYSSLEFYKNINDKERQKYIKEIIVKENLDNYTLSMLNNFKNWIYRKRRDALKEKLRKKEV